MARHTLQLDRKIDFSQNIIILYFKSETKIEFEPGQFLKFEVAPMIYRSYSIFWGGDEVNDNMIGIIVNTTSGGLGSQFIKKILPQDKVNIIGPIGKLAVSANDNQNVFVATSTGLSPFIPMIQKIRKVNTSPITIYFGIKTISDNFALDLLKDITNTDLKICLSQQIQTEPINNLKYPNLQITTHFARVDAALKQDIAQYNKQSTNFYLCGNPQMVQETSEYLKINNFNNIYEEKFLPS
jgi:all-trans-retinol 13,14-reductase